jgi:hypothetical protein
MIIVATPETREIPGACVSGDRVLIMLSDGYEVTNPQWTQLVFSKPRCARNG